VTISEAIEPEPLFGMRVPSSDTTRPKRCPSCSSTTLPRTKKIATLLARNVKIILKIFFYPQLFVSVPTPQGKVLPELVDYLLWGFGEKPIRIFVWMVVVIAAFTGLVLFSASTPT
jgi:hypothetical protein